jgi:hypothetical protein
MLLVATATLDIVPPAGSLEPPTASDLLEGDAPSAAVSIAVGMAAVPSR